MGGTASTSALVTPIAPTATSRSNMIRWSSLEVMPRSAATVSDGSATAARCSPSSLTSPSSGTASTVSTSAYPSRVAKTRTDPRAPCPGTIPPSPEKLVAE